jgi:hypothetical protein
MLKGWLLLVVPSATVRVAVSCAPREKAPAAITARESKNFFILNKVLLLIIKEYLITKKVWFISWVSVAKLQ